MKAKARLTWMKLHAYFACFFLPITLLYLVTGVLYLFDIKGGVKKTYEYPVMLTEAWPEAENNAKMIVTRILNNKKHTSLPEDYYLEPGGVHDWYGYTQEVILKPTEQPFQATLIVKEHDLLHQLLLIHKGHAGKLFWLLGISLGISLAFSLISGVVISLQLPQLKKQSLLSIGLGIAVLVVLFLQG
jgi:hypothetical protein